jgi:hypothetical protein
MKWSEAKPLLKRALIAAVIFPPIMALSHRETPVAKPATVKDSLKVYHIEKVSKPEPTRRPLLLNDRCVGIKPPAP